MKENLRTVILTTAITAVITATVTAGVPAVIKLFRPNETINVLLQDLRAQEPERFDQYIQTQLQQNNKAVMQYQQKSVQFQDDLLDCYLLGDKQYVAVSDLLAVGTLELDSNGVLRYTVPTSSQTDQPSQIAEEGTWLEQCPPYETGSNDLLLALTGDYVTIAGEEYTNVLLSKPIWSSQALFNLKGKYRTLTVYAGHVDGKDMVDCTYNFLVDGELVKTVTLKADQLLTKIEIPLNFGQQLSIQNTDTISYTQFGFVSGTFL